MLRHSALGVNIASTVSLELAMFDKPVINVGYNPQAVADVANVAGAAGLAGVTDVSGVDITPIDFATYYEFDHYRPVVQSGAVSVAWTEDEMRDLLIGGLTEPDKDSHKRKAFIRTMFGDTLDGKSGARVAETLLRLAGHRENKKRRKDYGTDGKDRINGNGP